MLIRLPLYLECRAHLLICSFMCRSIGNAGLICSFICRPIGNAGFICSFICCSIGIAVLTCTYSVCCNVGECLTFPSICLFPVVYVFSHDQCEGQEGCSCANSCLCDALLGSFGRQHEALPIVSIDRSSDPSGDDGLHQQIAELQDQSYTGFGVYSSVTR